MTAVYQQPEPADPTTGYSAVPEVPQSAPFQQLQQMPYQSTLFHQLSFQPAPLHAFHPTSGTIYFAQPLMFANAFHPPVFLPPLNMQSENRMMEMMSNECNASPEEAMEAVPSNPYYHYPPVHFPAPYPGPPLQAVPLPGSFARPAPMFYFPQHCYPHPTPANGPPHPPTVAAVGTAPFHGATAKLATIGTAMPASRHYEGWATTFGPANSQNGELKLSPRNDGTVINDANNTSILPQTSFISAYNNAVETGMNQTSFKYPMNNAFRNLQRNGFNRSEQMNRSKIGSNMNNYRTKLCINYKNGNCPYGDKCRFIHQPSDGSSKTFSTEAAPFVPGSKVAYPDQGSPSSSMETGASKRLYSSTPVSLLGKGQGTTTDLKETAINLTDRRVSYRQDLSAGYRRPSVADGPHSLPIY